MSEEKPVVEAKSTSKSEESSTTEDVILEPATKTDTAPEPKPEPATKTDTAPEPKPEPATKTDTEPKPEPATKTDTEPKPEPATKTDTAPESKPEPATKTDTAPESKPEPATFTTAKPATKSVGESKAEPVNDVQSKTRVAMTRAEEAIKAVELAEMEARLAAERVAAARREAEAAAEAEYKAIAAQVKADIAKKQNYTFKRQSEEIFRRDMGEPEFYLDKKDRFPRPILTPQQQESVTRKAEMPQDQTPKYVPERVLSPEFNGISNYERGVESYLEEARATLKTLKRNPESTPKEIADIKARISYLESLYENFYIGMNVFRTAKGGRSKS